MVLLIEIRDGFSKQETEFGWKIAIFLHWRYSFSPFYSPQTFKSELLPIYKSNGGECKQNFTSYLLLSLIEIPISNILSADHFQKNNLASFKRRTSLKVVVHWYKIDSVLRDVANLNPFSVHTLWNFQNKRNRLWSVPDCNHK